MEERERERNRSSYECRSVNDFQHELYANLFVDRFTKAMTVIVTASLTAEMPVSA